MTSSYNYDTPTSPAVERLISDLFALGGIGYVALSVGTEVVLRQLPGLATQTTAESNFFEELLVNPTLLKLAGQRGDLNCGGLDHIAVGYGDFTMVLLRMEEGHLALGVGRKTLVRELATRAHQVLRDHGRAYGAPQASLRPVSLELLGS